MTTKERVLELIAKMPDDVNLDQICYEIYVVESVQEGLDQIDKGDFLTDDELKKKLGKWLK